ncbi:6-phosphogluconolactonase, eukaryotic type [Roseibacterium elongatum DSM 19469]|uniref:6-phosphogluconolactonase n=1 Tax=Roseicyclus elongatus DSM 19469 TaxID=1294273 RepID=W8S8N0_9RHOB|nr:6-phosphogluconolactonase [Roseibacterium elongatum]AHM05331.1 6-phosphogluconolactonase, eukaryotic type [Roseibacterium elongatum DSM 19469]
MRNLIEYPDREAMMLDLADLIASELAETLLHEDRATLSVPGGTTPGPIFDVLSEQALDWDRISVVLNDERWVGEDSPRSNTALLKQRFLISRAAAATLVPLYAPVPTPEEALDELSLGLKPHLPISVLLLGMGADMHTASLFPGADNLALALGNQAPPLVAMRADGAGEPRITLSAPVLKGALRTHIVITGPEKRAAIERAAHLSPDKAPVRAVLAQATVHWAD